MKLAVAGSAAVGAEPAGADIQTAATPSGVSEGHTGQELPAQAELQTVQTEWTGTGIHIQ